MNTLTAQRTDSYSDDQPFFTRTAVVLAILIVVWFVQFSLRGFVNWRAMPWVIHAHGLAMLAWLGLFVVQNVLAERGDLARHRKLGRWAALLAVAIVPLGCAVGITALQIHTVPPFFTPNYFLALTQIEPFVFVALVFAAIARRRDTETHRRLMLGAVVVITEPAFGRLLPMPLLGPWGEWAELACQLVVLVVLAAHDRRVLGRVHSATVSAMAIVVVMHVLVVVTSTLQATIGAASRIAGAD